MNRKAIHSVTLITVFILATVFAVCALYKGVSGLYTGNRTLHNAFPEFKVEDAAKVTIRWKHITTTLIRKGGHWFIAERNGLPASAGKIQNLLNALKNVSPVKEVPHSTKELLERLHLTEGDKSGKVPGITVLVQAETGKELFRILFGKGHFLRPEAGTPQAPHPEGRYVLVNGKVYLIPLVFEDCHPVPNAWVEALQLRDLQKSLFMAAWKIPANEAKMQTLFQVFRRSTAHPFTLIPPGGKQADNKILSGMAAELSKPFTGDYFMGDRKLLQGKESIFLLIRSADGFSYRLQVTDHNDQTDVLSLKVIFDPARVVKIPGETKEQYDARIKTLEKRFAEEKFYTEDKLFLTGKRLRQLLQVSPVKVKTSTGPWKPKDPASAVKK